MSKWDSFKVNKDSSTEFNVIYINTSQKPHDHLNRKKAFHKSQHPFMIITLFKLVLEKAEEPEIKLPTSTGSWKKQESSRKTSISALLTMPKPLTV